MNRALARVVWSLLAVAAVTVVGHPLVLAVWTAAVVAIVAAEGALDAFAGYARYALLLGAVLVAVNPVVAPLGRTVLARAAFTLPVLGRPVVTLEALAFGATQTLRLLALLAPFAVVADLDPEALFDALDRARVPTRAALATALSVRFLPAVADDAATIRQAQQDRGLETGGAAGALPVLRPLLARSVDRGMDVAEALAARGFGAGPRSRIVDRSTDGPPVAVLAAVPVGLALAGLGAYSFYPVLDPLALSPVDVAATLAGAAALAAPALVRWRS